MRISDWSSDVCSSDLEADLLPVGYFHVVFTLPAEVAAIAFTNKALVYDLLFKAAADTMLTIAADPRHLGARIGITAVLHTWGSARSEEHTSELQSLMRISYAVFCLKKKTELSTCIELS